MSGPLLHSPADVLARVIVALGLGTSAQGKPWHVQADKEPSSPDDAITVYNTEGRVDARTQVDGEYQEHEGFQVRVRATDSKIGFNKIQAIAYALATAVYEETVNIDSSTYVVHCAVLKGSPTSLGVQPNTSRYLFTLNGQLALRKVS